MPHYARDLDTKKRNRALTIGQHPIRWSITQCEVSQSEKEVTLCEDFQIGRTTTPRMFVTSHQFNEPCCSSVPHFYQLGLTQARDLERKDLANVGHTEWRRHSGRLELSVSVHIPLVAGASRQGLSCSFMLTPGDIAPVAALLDQNGVEFDWTSVPGTATLVFFYPRASTPGCTQQACGLRDILPQISTTRIVGVSPDKPAAQKKFAEKNGLTYPLLSDTDHVLAEAYGVWKDKQLYGRHYMGIERSAFLIDGSGVVTQAWYKISPKDTPLKLLAALDR